MASPTTVSAAPAGPADERLGGYIRRFRRARRLTLVQLADATDLSHSFLSQMERGRVQPSLASLRRIAEALETSPLELIAGAEAPSDEAPLVEVRRADAAGTAAEFAHGTGTMLSRPGRLFHTIEYSASNRDLPAYFDHPEYEFLYVLQGRVRVDFDGEVSELGPGDSAHYAGTVPHRWSSVDGAPYRLLLVKEGGPLGRADG